MTSKLLTQVFICAFTASVAVAEPPPKHPEGDHKHDHDHKEHDHDDHKGHDHDDHKGHDHDDHKGHVKKAGPHGGRLVSSITPNVEIVLTDARKLVVNVLDKHGKPTDPSDFEVSAIGGSRSNPTKLTFAKEGNRFVSTTAVPAGNKTPVVVTLKPTKNGKAVYERFHADQSSCGSCEYKEYACVCGH